MKHVLARNNPLSESALYQKDVFEHELSCHAKSIHTFIQNWFNRNLNNVEKAMLYSLLSGGKHLRGALVIETAKLFDISIDKSIQLATALECLHTYSLVHDDLPDMDNSDLRRGQPASHIAFDPATAILVGDGLQTLAFEMLSDPEWPVDPLIKNNIIHSFAQAAGSQGMVEGQMLDIIFSTVSSQSIEDVRELQSLKTGQLFNFACKAGGLLGKATQEQLAALHTYTTALGLIFQITDDILDVKGCVEKTGKHINQDTSKVTFVDLMGMDKAIQYTHELATQAAEVLHIFKNRAIFLENTLSFSLHRDH